MSHVRVLHLPVHGVVQKQCVAGTLLYSNVLPLLCPLCRGKKKCGSTGIKYYGFRSIFYLV